MSYTPFNISNFGSLLSGGSGAWGGMSGGGSASLFTTLQNPSNTQAANQVNASYTPATAAGVTGSFPSWLSSDPSANINELMQTYAGIPAAFDSTKQVNAINAQIGSQTTQGQQAANNAASQYAAAAQQAGGSTLGAGVVKAQSMMPVFSANASLHTQAANVAAQNSQAAASLAANVASTIGNLRQSYLNTLANYTTSQQQLGLQTYEATQNVASQAANRQLQAAQIAEQGQQSQIAAATALLGQKGPTGSFTTNNFGQVTSGQQTANALNTYNQQQSFAKNYLASLI